MPLLVHRRSHAPKGRTAPRRSALRLSPGSNATAPAAALTALGDPTRRAIFERVADAPSAVGEIAAGLPVSRPAVSQHLRVLEHAGLVRHEARGTRRVYSVDPDGLAAVRAYFHGFWDRALTRFKDLAEQDHQQEERR
jgi:DNA-binding transcriptional ArsR family regulator